MKVRSVRYWTPHYLVYRITEKIYQLFNPDHPWLARPANSILSSYLKSSDIGLEFGSGRSTSWFARRVRHLTSVEHISDWYNRVREDLMRQELKNVSHLFVEREEATEENGKETRYVKVIDKFDPNSLDFVLVDGIYRSACTLLSIEKIRPGGILIVDDVNWFLPSESHSPDSRKPHQCPASPLWAEFLEMVLDWRRIWTSSGVHDTAIFFKPFETH